MMQTVIQYALAVWDQAVPWWNLGGLPVLMVGVAILTLRRGRAAADRRGIVRRIGMIAYALAAWWLVRIVSEVWAARRKGWRKPT